MIRLDVGQVWIGQKAYAGMCVRVLGIVEETPTDAGAVRVFIEMHSNSELPSVESSIKHHEPLHREYADTLRRFVTKPREDSREPRWFAEWQRNGLLRLA